MLSGRIKVEECGHRNIHDNSFLPEGEQESDRGYGIKVWTQTKKMSLLASFMNLVCAIRLYGQSLI